MIETRPQTKRDVEALQDTLPMAMDELLGGGVLVPGAAAPLTAGSMVYPPDV